MTTDVRGQLAALLRGLGDIANLSSASALLHWDQETGMPRGAADGRARVLSTLAATIHERLVAPELREKIEALLDPEAAAGLSSDETALVRLAYRDSDRASRLDEGLVRDLAAVASRAQVAWAEARSASSFKDFAPHLERLIALKRLAADALGFDESPLDAFLEDYEPGATVANLEILFAKLSAELRPLVAAVAESKVRLDPGPLRRAVPDAAQREFAAEVASAMGFDFGRGRLDRSTHPFCQGVHDGDVRLTWRAAADDIRPALFGVIHEAGHGLYEQGLPGAWRRTPLAEACSLGVHESQSRLWENMVARSRPFWTAFLPRLRGRCPGVFDDVDVEAIHRAANEVRPSLIRVEADELTYTLGNLYAAQLMEAARRAIGDLDERIARGELTPLRDWLRAAVHEPGRKLEPAALIEAATGSKPSERPFVDYVRAKYGELYGLGR